MSKGQLIGLFNVIVWTKKTDKNLLRIPKGQIISKGLFGVLEFSQKKNKRIRRSSKNELVSSFFGRI